MYIKILKGCNKKHIKGYIITPLYIEGDLNKEYEGKKFSGKGLGRRGREGFGSWWGGVG